MHILGMQSRWIGHHWCIRHKKKTQFHMKFSTTYCKAKVCNRYIILRLWVKVLQMNRTILNSEYKYSNEIVVDCIIHSCHVNWTVVENVHSNWEFLHTYTLIMLMCICMSSFCFCRTFSRNSTGKLRYIKMLLTDSSVSSWHSFQWNILNTNPRGFRYFEN